MCIRDRLILPDHVLLDEQWAARIRRHLDRGGAVLSTAWSGLDHDCGDFVFPEWGAAFRGDSPYDPAFFTAAQIAAHDMPDMPITLYQRGTCIEARGGAQALGEIIAPYYNRHWDGEHGFVYLPPDRPLSLIHIYMGRTAGISHIRSLLRTAHI